MPSYDYEFIFYMFLKKFKYGAAVDGTKWIRAQ